MKSQAEFDQVAFSGGGIRCFWHGGFLSQVGSFDDLQPERVSGVSGGALSGAAWIGGVESDLLDLMREAFDLHDRNVRIGEPKLTPHQHTYRAVVSTTLDAGAMQRIIDGPQFEIILASAPKSIPATLSAVLGGALYKLEEAVRSTPHLGWSSLIGLEPLRVDARQAARDGQLVDLICAAATIPPVFDVPQWQNRRILDGGMCDKAPLPHPDEGKTLVLLTKPYRNIPSAAGRTYVHPSSPVAADKIDFTDSSKVTRTWEQGIKDAKSWLASRDSDPVI
uniref:patatin-like phospholipase family protein n=1 Tax=Parerythrobacter lutipelagi TaxID=1964208 RepID=UPI0010F7A476|nr:patatin-like phospholipase family protein [Parerythrobacter lutipelagi]